MVIEAGVRIGRMGVVVAFAFAVVMNFLPSLMSQRSS